MQGPAHGLSVAMPPSKIAYARQPQQRWLADEVQALIQVLPANRHDAGWSFGQSLDDKTPPRMQEANESTASVNLAVQHLEARVLARRAAGSADVMGELFSDVEAQVSQRSALACAESDCAMELQPLLLCRAVAFAGIWLGSPTSHAGQAAEGGTGD